MVRENWRFIAILGAIVAAFFLFTVYPALALLPLLFVVVGVVAFARWDQARNRPPEP